MKKKVQALKLDGEALKCEVCATRDATVLCDEDNVRLCSVCDMTVHGANKIAQRHTRWPLCSVCHRLKATKTSTTPQEQGIDVCTSCASTVPKGKLHKVAGALAAPALQVPQEQGRPTGAAPCDSSECFASRPLSTGAPSGQQVWVSDATLVLGSGTGPPGGRQQATLAEAVMQQTAPQVEPLGRNQGLQAPMAFLGSSYGACMDNMNCAAEGMQLRRSQHFGGCGGADTPDVLDALFSSWGEEGGTTFEEREVDPTATAAGDLDLSIWADSPTDVATGAPTQQPTHAAHAPSPYPVARPVPDRPGPESATTAVEAVGSAGQSPGAGERADQNGRATSQRISDRHQPGQHQQHPQQVRHQEQQQHRQQQEQQQELQRQRKQQERVLHPEVAPGGGGHTTLAAPERVDDARTLEPSAGLESSSFPFEHQLQAALERQQQQYEAQQCHQALCQAQQYGMQAQDVVGGFLQGRESEQQQHTAPSPSQRAAFAAMEVAEQPYTRQTQQLGSPSPPRQRSSNSQAMECLQPPQSHHHHQHQGGQSLSREPESSTGQRQRQPSAAGQAFSQAPLTETDMAGALQGVGSMPRPLTLSVEGGQANGANLMPWMSGILTAQYQGLAPEQQLAVNSFLMKQDPAALQSPAPLGGVGAAGGGALPATGMLAPSPRQSCDGTAAPVPLSQPQQPFHGPIPSASTSVMSGGYPQAYGSCMAFVPGIRADKVATNPLYEAALLSAAGIVSPWRHGLLPTGLPVGTGGLQLPAGLIAAAAAAGPLQLPLLGPIQTLTSAAWSQAAAAQSSGPHAPGVAGSGQGLSAQLHLQQQAQQGEAATGATQQFANGGSGGGNTTASFTGNVFTAVLQQHQQHGHVPVMQPQPQSSGLSATQHQVPPNKQEPSTSSAQGTSSHHGPAPPCYKAQYAPPQLVNRISSNGGRALAPPVPTPGPGLLSGMGQPTPHNDCVANTSGGGGGSNAAAAHTRPPQQQQQPQPQVFAARGSQPARSQQVPHQQAAGQPQGLGPSLSQAQQQQQAQTAGAGLSISPQGFQQQASQQFWQQQQQQPTAQARSGGVGLLSGNSNASALLLFNQQQQQQLQQLQQLLLQSAGQGPKNQQQLLMQLAQQQQQQHILPQSAMLPPTAGLAVSPDGFGGLLMSPMAQWLMMNMSHASSTASVQQGAATANTGGGSGLPLGLQLPPCAAAALGNASAAAAAAAAAAVAGLTSVPTGPVLVGSQGGAPPAAATVAAATSAVMPGGLAPEASKVSRERDPRDREPRDHAERDEALTRYRQKRKTRHFEKTIRYASRQILSHKRPRIKGRFVKTQPCQAAIIGMSPVTTHEPPTSEDPEAGDEADDEQEAELEEVEEENDLLGPGGEGLEVGGPNKSQRETDGGLMMDLDGPAAGEGPQEAVAEGGLGLGPGGVEGCEDGPGCGNSCDAMEMEVSGGAPQRDPRSGGGGGGPGSCGAGGGCASSGARGLCTVMAVAAGRGASVGCSNEKASFEHASVGATGGLAAAGYGGAASAAQGLGANPGIGNGHTQHHHQHHHHYAGGRHYNHHHVSVGHLTALAGPPSLGLGLLGMGTLDRPTAPAVATVGSGDVATALGDGEGALRLFADMELQHSGQNPALAQAALSGSAHAQAQRGISGGTHGGCAEEEEAVGPSHSVNSRLSAGSVHTPGRWRALGGTNGTSVAAAYEEVGPRGGVHSHPCLHAHPPAHAHPHQHDGATYWISAGVGTIVGNSGMTGRQTGNGGAARGNGGSGAAEADGTVSTNGATKTGGAIAGKVTAKISGNGNGANGGGISTGNNGLHKAATTVTIPVVAMPCSVQPGTLHPVGLSIPLPLSADVLMASPAKSAADAAEMPPQVFPTMQHLLIQRQIQQQHRSHAQHPMLAPGSAVGHAPVRPTAAAVAVAAAAAAAVAAAAGGCSGGGGGPGGCGGGIIGARHSPKRQQNAAFDMPPCLPMPSTASCGGVSPLAAAGTGMGGAGAAGCRGTPAACCMLPDCGVDAAAPCCMSGGGTTEQGSFMEDNHTLVDAETAGCGAGDGEGDSECCSAEPLVSGASNTVPSVEASTHGQGQQRMRGRRSSPQLSVRM